MSRAARGRLLWVNPASLSPAYDFEALCLLAREGWALSYHGSRTAYNEEAVTAMVDRFGGHLFSISSTMASRPRGVLSYLALMASVLWQARSEDRIVLSFPSLLIVDALFLLLAGKKGILLVHNVVPHDHPGQGWKDQLLAACARKLWFASRHTAAQAQRTWGLKPSKVEAVLQHGRLPVAPGEGLPEALVAEQAPLKRAGRLRLAVLGNIKPYKGVVPFLSQVLAQKPEAFEVSIQGRWAPGHQPRLEDFPEALVVRLEDSFLSSESLRQALLASPIVVMPYLAASQSGIFYNCLWYGCIPLVTSAGEAAERLKTAGLARLCFSLEQPESFIEACAYVEAQHPEVIRKLRRLREDCSFTLEIL